MSLAMDDSFWSSKYPPSVKKIIDVKKYDSLLSVFENSCRKYRNKPAFSNMGHTLTYGDLDRLSANFASYLQHHTNLQQGDRIAIQLPNLLQYPIVLFGAIRAGLIIVNTNPLYTAREMEHQFNDAGCKALVALANFGNLVQEVLPKTQIETLIITEIGDALPPLKRVLVNSAVKYVKKMIPKFSLPQMVSYNKALSLGQKSTFRADFKPNPQDIAALQYTGGTTGVAKGAMLTHANLVANMLQMNSMLTSFKPGEEILIAPLPMYHIFCFTVSCMGILELGCHSVLITNPRDISGFIKELKRWKFSSFAGLNTLFVALMNHPEFKSLDFRPLKLTISGGMALQASVADRWRKVTGGEICEGYGMTETSPVVCVNPPSAIQVGTIGLPVPNTLIKIISDEGKSLGVDEPGELCVKGPQVMKGYWMREEATQESYTADGWLKTGDVALVQEDGYLRIVDRKKDMILVSGFNVYPNDVEEVISAFEKVVECAVIGIPDEKSGEVVKVFVVPVDASVTKEEIKAYCKSNLTGYKVPKIIEFRDELPKSNVGKILRRELRDAEVNS